MSNQGHMAMPEGAASLLVIRTPFQALMAERILAQIGGFEPYDLIYVTQNLSPEDRTYFGELANGSRQAELVHVPPRSPDILNHLRIAGGLPQFARRGRYRAILFASFTSPALAALACRHREAELHSFDDGIGNIQANGLFGPHGNTRRERVYRRALGAPPVGRMLSRVAKHYTIYPGFDNIVEAGRLHSIELGFRRECSAPAEDAETLRFFIGQPFIEALSTAQIARLRIAALAMRPNFYVSHPRERTPLALDARPLDKGGRLAEHAILERAGSARVEVIGWFSAAMLNLAGSVFAVHALLPRDHPRYEQDVEIAKRFGLFVHTL